MKVLNTKIMLNRRSQIYEIQKPKANNGGHHRGHTNHNNKPDKMAAGFVATSAASVHSNSFNFSSSASPSSGTSGASATNGNSESHNNLQAVSRKNTKQQPRMGIPIMTSTPRGGQTRTSSTNVEEPIYCEIPSPCKGRRMNYPPPLPSRGQQQQHQNGLRSSWRPKTEVTSDVRLHNHTGLPPKTNAGLGRRAITQLEMSTAGLNTSSRRPLASARPWPQPLRMDVVKPEPEFFRNNAATSSSSEVHPNVQNGGSTNSAVEATAISVQTTSLLKGVLWQQREKRFSRWKERFFMLTNEYLQCFRKGTSKISEMGGFIYRIRLSEIDDVELIERRGYLTLRLSLPKEGGKLLLRKTDGIRKWYLMLQEYVEKAKKRRVSMKSTEEFWSKRQHTDSSAMESWILSRQNDLVMGHPQNCWSETGSCVSESASTTILPNHLKRLEPRRNNMETSSQIVPPGRKSYNNIKTTHYGLIDWPNSTNNGDSGLKSPNILMNRKNSSHDSGVDSMNTNSSGSMMSSSATSRQKSPLIDPPLGEKCSKPIMEMEKFSTKNSLLLVDPDKFSRQITLV